MATDVQAIAADVAHEPCSAPSAGGRSISLPSLVRACMPRFRSRRAWVIFFGVIAVGVWLNFGYCASLPFTRVLANRHRANISTDAIAIERINYRYGWPWRTVHVERIFETLDTLPARSNRYAGSRFEIDWLRMLGAAGLIIGVALFLATFHDEAPGNLGSSRRGILRYLPRYRFRTFLLYSIAFACWLGLTIRRGVEQKALVELIQSKPGEVRYDQRDYGMRHEIAPQPGPTNWLEQLLGEECFREVVAVSLIPMGQPEKGHLNTAMERAYWAQVRTEHPYRRVEFSLDELKRLLAFSQIEWLEVGDTEITPEVVAVLQQFPYLGKVMKKEITPDEYELLTKGLPHCDVPTEW